MFARLQKGHEELSQLGGPARSYLCVCLCVWVREANQFAVEAAQRSLALIRVTFFGADDADADDDDDDDDGDGDES